MNDDKQYIIITLSVSGKGNNIYRSKDVVLGSKLNNVGRLIDDGSIELYESKGEGKEIEDMDVKELVSFYESLEPSEEEMKEFKSKLKDDKIEFLKSL